MTSNKLRVLPLLVLFSLLTIAVSGQAKVGLRGGVVISKQDFQNHDPGTEIKSKLGADVAVVFDFPVGAFFSIGPELHWMQKGAKVEDLNGPFGEVTRTFNYLEVPVLFKFNFSEPVGLFAFLGPSFGYLLDGTDKDGDGNTNDIDLDFWKRGDVGAHVGAGMALGPVKVDVRYLVGFANIFDAPGQDVEVKNSGFGAGITLMF